MPAQKPTIAASNYSELQLYPWQAKDWQQLSQYQDSGKIPHALLISGKAGLAKFDLAMLWAKTILCDNRLDVNGVKTACNHCASCELFNGETHPDFKLLQKLDDAKTIKIDQVREVVEFLSLTRARGNARLVVINPAEAMTVSAANSLLKTLEEPPENTILLLVSSNPSFLPATIRSRCQNFLAKLPDVQPVHQWLTETSSKSPAEVEFALKFAENAPLTGLAYLEANIGQIHDDLLKDWHMLATGSAKSVKITEKWLKQPDNIPIKLVYSWIVDMIRYHSMLSDTQRDRDVAQNTLLYYKDNVILKELATRIPAKRLYGIYDKVLDIIRYGNTSLNAQLQMESLLVQWSLVAQTR